MTAMRGCDGLFCAALLTLHAAGVLFCGVTEPTERKGTREYLQVFNPVQRCRGVTTNFSSLPQSNSAVCKLADCT